MIDAKPEVGGRNLGPSPKKLLLASLAGCTGMDVVSLFKKMRFEVDDFSIEVVGELTDEHPQHYDEIKMIYKVYGKNLEEEKIKKAINLSIEKYCGVSYMLEKSSKLSYEIQILDSIEA
jgi:putative redox protein